jgi:hypothetical protein
MATAFLLLKNSRDIDLLVLPVAGGVRRGPRHAQLASMAGWADDRTRDWLIFLGRSTWTLRGADVPGRSRVDGGG